MNRQINKMNIFDVIAKVKTEQDAKLTKFNAMTTAEKEQYALNQAAKEIELEKILNKLRGNPGFMEISL